MKEIVNKSGITLYVVRHGETEYNRLRLMQGQRIDAPLNARGELQAEALAARFLNVPLHAVYTSPLRRARQTAQAVLRGHPNTGERVMEDLAEMSWGELEGQSIDAVGDELRRFASAWKKGRFDDCVGGGESILDVQGRAARVLAAMEANHADQTVLLATHGRFMRVFLATAIAPKNLRTMDRFGHANTGVYRLQSDGAAFRLELANCTEHLVAMEAEA